MVRTNPRPSDLFWVLLLALAGCDKTQPLEPTRLCGLEFVQTPGVTLDARQNPARVLVTGRVASFMIKNYESDQAVDCTFVLQGPSVSQKTFFSREGRKDHGRVQTETLGPERLRVRYRIPPRSFGLVSLEPAVKAPVDPVRFQIGGVRYRLAEAALLRQQASTAILQSLGPASLVEMENPSASQLPVRFRLQNTSDRLSRPALTGLLKGRSHRVGKLGLEVNGLLAAGASARFELEPRKLPDKWSFAVGGDIKTELGVFLQLIEQMQLKADPLFMIATGDFTRNSLPTELQSYFARTAPIPFPIYPVKGNHEMRAQGQEHYKRWFGPDHYAFQVGGILFAVLDSSAYETRAGKTGFVLGEEQFAWLDGLLKNRSASQRILATHCPPHPLHGESEQSGHASNMHPQDSQRLRDLAFKHKLAYVLSGHAHLYARGTERGTVYLTSGGGGAKLYSHEQVKGFEIDTRKHLLVLEVGPGGIKQGPIHLPRPVNQ